MPSVTETAILIINFNSCEDILRALSEFYNPNTQSNSNIVGANGGSPSDTASCVPTYPDIVVVDNASSDDSVQKIKENFPQVRLIENKENLGFAKACNIGLKHIDKPYVLIMNPDVVIKAEDVDELVKFLKYHPDGAAVGPRLATPDGRLLPSVFRLPTLTQELGHLFCVKCIYHCVNKTLSKALPCSGQTRGSAPTSFLARWFGQFDPHDKVRRCEMLVGSCVVFRKSALDDVGGFDEDFFLYYEEKDLFKRLADKGYHTYFTPFAHAIHAIGKSADTVPELAKRARYESMMRYHEKHSPTLVQKIIRGLIILSRH